MEYVLRYRSSRADVWRWYWRAWREKLWRIHVPIAAIAAFFVSGSGVQHVHFGLWALWFLALQLAVTALFAAVPQIMFKSAERTLRVDARGWSTEIGKKSGARTWAEVASIRDENEGVLIVGINGNALIIPHHVLGDITTRNSFLDNIRLWKDAYAG